MTTASAPNTPIARRVNVPFVFTLALLVGAYVIALYVLRTIIPEPEVAGTLAALVLGAGPWLQQRIEQRVRWPAAAVVSLDGYRIRWWLILLVGIGVMWLAEAVPLVIGFRAGPITAVSTNIRTVLTLVPVAAALGIGLVAGARSERFAFGVTVLAIVIGHLLSIATSDRVVEFAVGSAPPAAISTPAGGVPPPDGSPPGGPPSDLPPDPRPDLLGTGPSAFLLDDLAPLLALVGMAGLWWGSRMQLGFYLGHLAAGLDPRSRSALVEIAEQEARDRSRGPDV